MIYFNERLIYLNETAIYFRKTAIYFNKSAIYDINARRSVEKKDVFMEKSSHSGEKIAALSGKMPDNGG